MLFKLIILIIRYHSIYFIVEEENICLLPPRSGGPQECHGRYRRWHYSNVGKNCREFIYGGCGGNDNNFESQSACEARCNPNYSFYERFK